jgi:C1A family cysteine protease
MSQVVSDYLRQNAVRIRDTKKMDETLNDFDRNGWEYTDKRGKHQDMTATYLSEEFLVETERSKRK